MSATLGHAREEIRVLHVDDDTDFLEMAATFIEREDERVIVETAPGAGEGLDRLADESFDCIVSDYEMPGQDGIEFLKTVRGAHPELPFILFTGKGSEEIASEAVSAGVTDYLQKGSATSQYTVLANRISNVVEQYRSRRAIEETEQKLSQLAEHTDDILFMFDGQLRELLFFNSAYEEIWGAPAEELQEDPEAFLEYIHPEDRERVTAAMARNLEAESTEIEYRVNRPDGGQRWVLAETKPIPDGDGGIERIVGFVRDITDRKERERELRRKERQYQAVFNDPNILVGSIDTDGTVLDINDTAMGYIDAELADVVGEPFWETPWFAHADAVQTQVREWIRRAAEGEYVEFEADLERPDGTPYTVEGVFRPVTDADGEVVSLLISDRDITERTRRQRELERTNAMLSTLFDALPYGVLVEDESRTVSAVNEQFLELFGIDGSPGAHVDTDARGITGAVAEQAADPERFAARVEELIATGEHVVGEEVALSDGRTVERTYRPLELPAGRGHLVLYADVSDRKARERELETVNQRFEAVLDNTTTPMFMKDDEGGYLFVNGAYRELFGLEDAEIVGRTDREIHSPAIADEVQRNDRTVLARGEPVETEERVEIDGAERIFLSTKVPIYDTGDRSDPDAPVATFGVATDITERKAAERKLREEQEFVRSIFRSLPDPLYAFDTEGTPMRWNAEFEAVTGYDASEIEGMHVTAFVPEDETAVIAEKFATILEDGRAVAVETAVETKEGERIPYELTGGPLEAADGTVRGITGVGRDIQARRTLEARLKALNRATHELMLADSREEVARLGVETTRDVLGLEANAIHLYDERADGLAPVGVTGAVRELVGEPPTFTDADSIAWRVYEAGEPLAVDDLDEDPDVYNPDTAVQSELYLPLGEYGVLLAASGSPETFDDQDVVLGEILAAGLVTALEQVERTERLRRRERELVTQNDRLEEFTSIVSHDLRNPLGVAEGRLELAAAECESVHLEHIGQAHTRMRALIDDLLALAREGEAVAETSAVSLPSLVESCWATVETGEATLVADVDGAVQADESRLKQVFENLIRNAVEHGGDAVTVTVGPVDGGFYVADDGPGIPADERAAIFDAGYSTGATGTGFGLSIVAQIVEAHGWEIEVTESEAGGARFEIRGVDLVCDD